MCCISAAMVCGLQSVNLLEVQEMFEKMIKGGKKLLWFGRYHDKALVIIYKQK